MKPHSDPRHAPPTSPDPVYSIEQSSIYLNTSIHHVRRLISRRDIEFVKVGALVRIRQSELERFIRARTVPAAR